MRKEVRESHRGMVDGCRWSGGGMGYSRLPDAVIIKIIKRRTVGRSWVSTVLRRNVEEEG